jgi:hypothetical protein
MTRFARIIRSLTHSTIADNGFESYYGAIVRKQPEGGPTAAEARRDYRSVRSSVTRLGFL